VLGPEHSQVAYPLTGLANVYREQGRYEQAEPLYQRALAIRRKHLGPQHPDVAETLHYFAHFYELQQQTTEALSFYLQALTIREQTLGVDHPQTIITRTNYTRLLKDTKKQ
jgi:tetratricopeptide (TPR) repeat protein